MKKMVFILTEIVSLFLFEDIDLVHVLLGCSKKRNRTDEINIVTTQKQCSEFPSIGFYVRVPIKHD